MIKNIIITGIGGQGVIHIASLLRKAVLYNGYSLKGCDNRGGAQRLGHVSATIRYTKDPNRIFASEIPPESANLLISLEATEGLRFFPTLSKKTEIVISNRIFIPTNQRRKRLPYLLLSDCEKAYKIASEHIYFFDFIKLATQNFGESILSNLLALGTGLSRPGFEDVSKSIETFLNGKFLEAFFFGKGLIERTY
ncbi:MAG: 2-oxoacid:acceptor oxidoreductase family protein [Candidatus Riflebacteria bacterium]|nr:2-oxoacid:acceptor oxidoreductase family protein [Candidatus Riflebacteria bacterium]